VLYAVITGCFSLRLTARRGTASGVTRDQPTTEREQAFAIVFESPAVLVSHLQPLRAGALGGVPEVLEQPSERLRLDGIAHDTLEHGVRFFRVSH